MECISEGHGKGSTFTLSVVLFENPTEEFLRKPKDVSCLNEFEFVIISNKIYFFLLGEKDWN